MIYRSPSATKKAPSVALSHAAASLRVCATAASCSLPRILTTQEWASKSASASEMARRYSFRALGLSVRKCARSITAARVSSTEGAGRLSLCESSGLGITQTPRAPTRQDFITPGNSDACKAKNVRAARVNHLVHKREKAGLEPDPSLCCSVSGGASPERVRNLARLPEGFGLASPSRLRKPVSPPVDHLPCREIHGDDLGHVVVLKSVPVPVRPRLVTL